MWILTLLCCKSSPFQPALPPDFPDPHCPARLRTLPHPRVGQPPRAILPFQNPDETLGCLAHPCQQSKALLDPCKDFWVSHCPHIACPFNLYLCSSPSLLTSGCQAAALYIAVLTWPCFAPRWTLLPQPTQPPDSPWGVETTEESYGVGLHNLRTDPTAGKAQCWPCLRTQGALPRPSVSLLSGYGHVPPTLPPFPLP